MTGSTQNALMAQDIALAETMTRLKNNPTEMAAWMAAQQATVYNDIVKQKNNTFEKVYGDFERASKVEESILMHNKRSRELTNIVDDVYKQQESGAQKVVQDMDLAARKKEMNEWSVGNKQDTLFVFSSLFIVLSGLLLLTGLWRMGMISAYLWVAMGAPLLIIFILIFVRRWRYTDALRNKRYWNKQIFEGKGQKFTVPSCAQLSEGIDSAFQQAQGAIAGAQGAIAGAQGVGTGPAPGGN